MHSRALFPLAVVAGSLLLAACGAAASREQAPPARIGHVFVLVLENEDYTNAFGEHSAAPYLARTLPALGAMLPNYYGTAHNSQGNYIAMISGQGPTPEIQADCHTYADFIVTGPTDANGQAVGHGCVYPAFVPSLPDQLEAAGKTWRGYMEDMGNDPRREAASCGAPRLDHEDPARKAAVGDEYATKHNPFVYLHRIVDDAPRCRRGVVRLEQLPADLARVDTTPNFSLIVPGLCNDGHDSPCVDGRPGGLVSADAFLREWVPRILAAPAFRQDGLLIVTFDESNGPQSDSSACCAELPGPNAAQPGINGPGGGRTGAVLISPFIAPGSRSDTAYNHYALLRSVEDLFGLPYLGYAGAANLKGFGADVYTARQPELPPRP
ncbi:MAG TPA: alkaline phosphatase family protein [Nevskia sp.]|nr:alkaline phosphatase family protein [Nevskia sp.]